MLVRFTLALALLVSHPALGASIFESVEGEFSADPGAPTPVVFDLGSNLLAGSLVGGDVDLVSFTLAAGQQLDAIELTTYTGSNRSFIALAEGDWPTGVLTSIIPTNLFGAALIGAADLGADVLALMPGEFGTMGGDLPLAPGRYSFLIQDTSDATDYGLTFLISAVPEPAVAGLLALAAAWLGRRTRRQVA